MKPNLTQDRLRELLLYDAETGIFTRRIKTGRVLVGDVAGSLHQKGYREIKVDYKHYFAHRLAFLYVEGVMPPAQVDHVNRVPSDNRYVNIRKATQAENTQNISLSTKNTSGLIGASWNRTQKKWESRIRAKGKKLNLGLFDTAEEAHAAYTQAKAALHTFQPTLR